MSATTSYDELPYTDNSFHYTHPDHMATVGRLYGLGVVAPEGCRVLELGCAMGGNLIPMALKFPGARFVGIDLSARQVEEGRATTAALGLANVDLRAGSILDVDAGWGEFDYIVCHGVYSWVPAPVREKILAIFAQNLAPGGLAYVSYNTFPGWHARGLARDLMAYHLRGGDDLHDSARAARAFLKDLVAILPDRRTAYAAILAGEGKLLEEVDDAYLYHEHLEETNSPFYFHQFMADASANGLGFVAEAKSEGLMDGISAEARERIQAWGGDPIAREQYLDFVINRTFRRSFLRREDDGPPPRPSPEAVATMAVGTVVRPESSAIDVFSPEPESFRPAGGGPALTTNHPMLKAAFLELALARPSMLPFDVLFARTLERLSARPIASFDPVQAAAYLRDALVRGFAADLITLSVSPPRVATEPGDAPTASPLARYKAGRGRRITNIAGRSVAPEDLDLFLLPLLDGSTPQAALRQLLRDRIAGGDFTVTSDDGPLAAADLDAAVAELVDVSLRRLAAMGLLVHPSPGPIAAEAHR